MHDSRSLSRKNGNLLLLLIQLLLIVLLFYSYWYSCVFLLLFIFLAYSSYCDFSPIVILIFIAVSFVIVILLSLLFFAFSVAGWMVLYLYHFRLFHPDLRKFGTPPPPLTVARSLTVTAPSRLVPVWFFYLTPGTLPPRPFPRMLASLGHGPYLSAPPASARCVAPQCFGNLFSAITTLRLWAAGPPLVPAGL